MSEILGIANLLATLVFLILFGLSNYTIFPSSKPVAQNTEAQTSEAPESERIYLRPQKIGIICIGWSIATISFQILLRDSTVDIFNPVSYLSPLTGWIPIGPLTLLLVSLIIARKYS